MFQQAGNSLLLYILFRFKYSDGVFAGQFQNSGVKMLIPLVVVPDCQEHYENVKNMRELVNVNAVECVSKSSDIKMILTEQGRQWLQVAHSWRSPEGI